MRLMKYPVVILTLASAFVLQWGKHFLRLKPFGGAKHKVTSSHLQ